MMLRRFLFVLGLQNRNVSKDAKRSFKFSSNALAEDALNNTFINLPDQARVVIAGAGVVANSVAYHLAQNGWTDVVVIEQGKIGSGTSRFGSGTLGLFKPISQRNLIQYSLQLYRQLQDMGYDIGLNQCGSVNLAQTNDRLIALQRRMAYNIPTGLHCELLNKEQLQNLHPYLNVDNIQGAVWVPEDGVANPQAICNTLALLAKQGGIKYIEDTYVEKILTANRSVYQVQTNRGNIKCEYFVNCAGMWARDLALRCSTPVNIPAYPAQHFYATTGRLDEYIDENTPIVRDYDGQTYAREFEGGFMVGWFEHNAQPAFCETKTIPIDWMLHIQLDLDNFRPLWENALNRIPLLSSCFEPEFVNSPDNFTPDGRWMLGETAEVNKYFVACGMNGNSLQGAGGIGKAVAEWIIEGSPSQDLLPFNVQRFLDVHNNRTFLQERIREIVGRHYAIIYPHQSEYKFGRNLRCSPLYSVLETRGAIFGIKMAYERALYFDTTYKKGQPKPVMPSGTYYKPEFFEFMKEEYLACKEAVGLIDMSSFSKIEVKSNGLEVVDYLQRLCSNDIDIPVGVVVHTGMQNEKGGYENDCMLVRKTENSYFVVSPTSQQTRIFDWMNKNLPSKSAVVLNDVTSMYTVLNVVGPKASKLLNELSNSNFELPPFSYIKVNVGYASDVMVMSFTHTGEPGYCLYVPSEYALHVYYQLIAVGRDYGVRDVGVLTQRFMRIERFIPFWAEELSSLTTPFESGNSYSVKLDKKIDFIGKAALQKQKENGVKSQLVLFQLENLDADTDVWPWGGEPLYRNDKFVGTVTSAGYGFSCQKLICLGFITRAENDNKPIRSDYIISSSAKYEIDIAGHRFLATPYLHAPPAIQRDLKVRYRPSVISYTSDISK